MPLRPVSHGWIADSLGGWRRRFRLAAAALVVVAAGCASDAAVAPPPPIDVSQMYWALTLNRHAVTLSAAVPYDTIHLKATPRTAAGEPLSNLPAPTFTSTDLERVQVDSTGLVHARGVGSQIAVVATLTQGNLVHADTVMITVTSTADPPVLASLSIHPVPPDTAKVAVDQSTRGVAARALKADSTAIAGLAIYYSSSDPTTATINRMTGRINPIRPGKVTLIASATAYGVTKADTLPYTIGYPVLMIVKIAKQTNASGQAVNGFVPNQITIGVGGQLRFNNQTDLATDVTFDDPTNVAPVAISCTPFVTFGCGNGNIEPFARDTIDFLNSFRARSISVPGTYPFKSTIFGTTGTVVVVDEHTP